MTYGFIGTGNMGGALARAAAQTVETRKSIYLANRTPAKAAALADEIGASVADNETIAQECDYILLGVKPQMMAQMLTPLAPVLARQRYVDPLFYQEMLWDRSLVWQDPRGAASILLWWALDSCAAVLLWWARRKLRETGRNEA